MQSHHTLHQFNLLPTLAQYGLLEDWGTYLDAYYVAGAHKIALFALYDYYVEVWLDQAQDRLTKVVAFNSYKKLDPFLRSIDIMPLYSAL